MSISRQLKNQHLLWRAGFGPKPEQAAIIKELPETELFKQLIKSSSVPFVSIDVADEYLKGLRMNENQVAGRGRMLSDEERRLIRRKNRDSVKNLNLAWINEMVNSEAQLREKMALFWHGHFACRNMNIFFQQALLDGVRKNALGNFGDLLRIVSKSAAMLNFLNNNQNRKGHPNENFAREVMELFTMGRGHYTETDVKEAARAFTGWGYNQSGEFVFRKATHDTGSKKFLNKEGNFDGDDILNILLERKETSQYITRKLYTHLVNEITDEEKVNWLAARFYQSNYNINGLLHDIFTSTWFYDEKNIGSHIKSPVELLVGIRRLLSVSFEQEEIQLLIQRLLGQVLFYPPNVAGWPGGRNWIDSSSLMFRLRIPQLMREGEQISLQPKDDDDLMMGMMENKEKASKKNKGLKSLMGGSSFDVGPNLDWISYYNQFKGVSKDKLAEEITQFIIQSPRKINQGVLKPYVDSTSRENFIRTTTIQLMSTPEYQLC